MEDTMIEFRAKEIKTETVLLRMSSITALFPDRHLVRTGEWSLCFTVHPDDWSKVEEAFRRTYPPTPFAQE